MLLLAVYLIEILQCLLFQPKTSLATLYHKENYLSSPLLSCFFSLQLYYIEECKVQSTGVQCLYLHKTC